jgi:AraC family transcriptional regulator, regulatory protein of adaptative response / DNA-3-methyladenine glycosylase II
VRTLATPVGVALLTLEPGDDAAHVQVTASDLGAIGPAMVAVRRLCDLAADIDAVETGLGLVAELAPMVRARPGLRVPGAVDGWEILVRAIVGQQVSVAAARTLLGRIVEWCGMPVGGLSVGGGAEWWVFPSAEDVAVADLGGVGLTGRRAATLRAAAEAAASGRLMLEPGDDLAEARHRLLALPGVGPWTAEYVALRALADPDAWPGTDLVLARAASDIDTERLRPWRAYAAVHLWTRYSEELA